MEEAKIGGPIPETSQVTAEPIFKDIVPGVITSDDLIFEIGKHVVRALNNEKFAEKILERERKFKEHAQESIDRLTKQLDQLPVLKKQNEELIRSNRSYEAKNHELAEALAMTREEVQKLTQMVSQKDFTIGKMEGNLESVESEMESLKAQIQLKDQAISALQSKISNTKKASTKKQ